MKLAVFGQRAIEDDEAVIAKLLELFEREGWDGERITYLHGGARGPQSTVLRIMEDDNDTVLFKPWSMVTDRLGKFRIDMFNWRNKQILDNADVVIIFDDGTPDREADYVIHYVRRHNIKYHVIRCER